MMWAFGLSFDGCSGGGASTQEAGSGGLAQFLVNVLEMSPGPLLWHPRPQAPLQRHVVSTGWTPRLLEFHCTDQARDHAHHSDLWQLPVKELKAGTHESRNSKGYEVSSSEGCRRTKI